MLLQFTTAGRAALVNAQHTGTRTVTVTQIGITEQPFIPDPEGGDTVLPGERKRLDTFGGMCVAPDVIHVTVRDETDDAYSLHGIGLYLDDGTLLCVYGQTKTLLEKSPQALMLLSADMALSDIDATQIQFGSTEFLNPPATVEVQGVVELATDQETIAGHDPARAVTPAALRAALDSRLGSDAPTALSKDLLAAATAAAMRALLELKGAALKDDGHGNGLDADLLDGQHGEFYLDWANMTGVPASTHIPGQVITFAGVAAPQGTLLCDGRTVLRADYPRLFAAIGLTYGSDVADDSFRLPKIDEGLGIVHTADPALVGQISAGEVIAHGHDAKSSGAGAHGHTITIGGGGGHSHGASASAVGDHAHGAWTDGQGSHTHGVGDPGHSHTWVGPNAGGGGGGWSAAGITSPNNVATSHNGTGIWIGEAGHHAHNIGMNGAGGHGHTINVAAVGDHTHSASASGVADHSHAIDVASTGGTRNLPAGVRMLYCITY